MMKNIGIILLSLIGLLIILGVVTVGLFNNKWFKQRSNDLIMTPSVGEYLFDWASISGDDYYEPHGAMIISFRLKNTGHKFYFQFDTGAPNSYLHGKSFGTLKSLTPDLSLIEEDGRRFIQNLKGTLGGEEVTIERMQVMEGKGQEFDPKDTLKNINLGTIGADFIEGKITQINFDQKFIHQWKERPTWMEEDPRFKSFKFKGRRVMLPSLVKGEKLNLFYDSGSSAFGLITSKYRYDKWAEDSELEYNDVFNMNGKPVHIYHKKSNAEFNIGSADLSLTRVSYVDLYAKLQRLMSPFTRISGWLGNKPFLEHSLILDTQKEEFFVMPKDKPSPFL